MKPTEQIKLNSISYIGPSMNPLLRAGDGLHVVPYDGKEIRCGDVIVFIPPGGGQKVTHRVVSVDAQGIRTRGDNNSQVDQLVLTPDSILGRVVCVHRGNRRRRIFGGIIGRVIAGVLRIIHVIDKSVSFLLRPAYHWLVRRGVFRQWVPRRMKTRVLSFKRPEGIELQLLWGRRAIGRLLPGRARWQIRRPFRLFVDEAKLPENKSRL